MGMKTAMQELLDMLSLTIPEIKNGNAVDKEFWLQKEKQQIIDAYSKGLEDGGYDWYTGSADEEHYYNKQFKRD